MHLVITSAEDVTAHLLFERLSDQALRVNLERWDDYILRIEPAGFEIGDRFGRVVTNRSLGNILWRKPVVSVPREQGERWYGFQEFRAGVEGILAQVRREAPSKLLIDPQRVAATDRFHQLRVAARYLPTPQWYFTTAPSRGNWQGGSWVAKSVTSRPMPGTGVPPKVLYTTEVDPNGLADGWPWFLQERIDAAYDLTVVYVDGESWAFLLDRSTLPSLDWRMAIGTEVADHGWRLAAMPHGLASAVRHIMEELGLRFGRLDLLARDPNCEDVVFLEVNPNGQWAWLDLDGRHGVMDAIVRFIKGEDPPSQDVEA